MTAVTRAPAQTSRFFSARNQRRGARAGLIAIGIQILLALGQVLPAEANAAEKPFVCTVYKTGTKAPAPETGRSGAGGHNTCAICLISSPGTGASPVELTILIAPAHISSAVPIPETGVLPPSTRSANHRVRAPPFTL